MTGAVTVVYDTQYSNRRSREWMAQSPVQGRMCMSSSCTGRYGGRWRSPRPPGSTGSWGMGRRRRCRPTGFSFDAVMWDLEASGDALYAGGRTARNSCSRFSQGPAMGPIGAQAFGASNATMDTSGLSSVGDPVDADSGALVQSATDIEVPGRGVGLAFTRTFDSRRAGRAGRLGFGWTDEYDCLLTVSVAASGPAKGEVTVAVRADGSENVFAPTGSGGYRAPRQVMASLVKNATEPGHMCCARPLRIRSARPGN